MKKQISSTMDRNTGEWHDKVVVGLPTTGTVRIEFMMARNNQIIPTNWGLSECIQYMGTHAVSEYLLPDAENLIAQKCIDEGAHLVSIEEDNLIPPNFFYRMNQYIKEKKYPVVGGLYFTKSVPPEPLIYRGRGNGPFTDFKVGDQVMCDGYGFGMHMIRYEILKAIWDESEEYLVNGTKARRIFKLPDRFEQTEGGYSFVRGTTDLDFYSRLTSQRIFEKAGFPAFQKMKYPLLCDTSLFGYHIDKSGRQFPLGGVPKQHIPPKNYKTRLIK